MDKFIDEIKFGQDGLVPVIVQDYTNNEVLMMAYMNREAFEKSMETGIAHYWSRSRNKLWMKGETSGHVQYIKSVSIDCDSDTLLLKVEQKEAACHTGHRSCFYRDITGDGIKENSGIVFDPDKVYNDKAQILQEVYNVILDRTINPKEGSYTNYLFEKGLDKILKKVGEETSEVIIAAKNKSKDEIRYEVADLIYHILVLLVERGLKLDEIYDELKSRR
ncbi:MAG TPA: bifunctional phosphoribosyl-AMP cyclohydrolase/phosphoribosyl-ATP diphosphatase HisIE [Clostridiaceae bacterium]|nr:bifunctional phosphoribosyl-AMP cyclohydrolase/phosphoribosyl-ATP diphosphatase HisIE [Clostridiaceae bacterium]